MKKTALAAVFFGSALVFSACSSTQEEKCSISPENLKKISVHQDLAEQITLTKLKTIKTESGMLTVAINGRDKGASAWNYVFHSYKMSRVKYRFDWIKGGKKAEVVKGKWQYLELKPGYIFGTIQEADNKAYVDFRFYMEPVSGDEWNTYITGKKAVKDAKAAPAKKAAETAPAKAAKK